MAKLPHKMTISVDTKSLKPLKEVLKKLRANIKEAKKLNKELGTAIKKIKLITKKGKK